MFIAALFTITKTWKPPKRPWTDEWIKKMRHIYTMEYYSVIKRNEIMPFAATRMDLEMIILSEVSQTEKDKYHMMSLICGINFLVTGKYPAMTLSVNNQFLQTTLKGTQHCICPLIPLPAYRALLLAKTNCHGHDPAKENFP